MKTLELHQMEQIEGGHGCAAEVAMVLGTTAMFAAAGPGGWLLGAAKIGLGIYRGHKLYHACFGS